MNPFGATRNDVEGIKSSLVSLVAKHIGVTTPERHLERELMEMIKERDETLFNKLESYIKALENWFAFHEKLKKESDGKFSSKKDEEEMHKLSTIKENQKQKLVSYLNIQTR